MELLANLLSGAATSSTESPATIWFVMDEPECPEELI